MATQTWKNQSGDWNTGTLWMSGTVPLPADTAIFNTTSAYTATIGATSLETQTVTGVTFQDANAFLEIQADNSLVVSGTFSLLAGAVEDEGTLSAATFNLQGGNLDLSGLLTGGTLFGNGGSLVIDGGTLSHETIRGTVAAGNYYSTLDVIGGLSFATGGVLEVTGGYGDVVMFGDSETLSGGVIGIADNSVTLVAGAAPVTFATGFTVDFTGATETLVGSFVNDGTIIIAADESLTITPADLSGTGVIVLGAFAKLNVANLTTAELTALAAKIVNQGGLIDVTQTLDNTGATLDYTTGTIASETDLSTAAIIGGTIILPTGSSATPPSFSTLVGVSVDGPLVLDFRDLNVAQSIVLHGAGGTGPGTVVLEDSSITFADSEVLDNATITTTSAFASTNEIAGPIAGALTLGANLIVQIGTGEIDFDAGTVVNDAVITVANGAAVSFTFSGNNFTDSGSVVLAAGGTAELSGSLTTAQLLPDLTAITGPGTIVLAGTLINTGATLDLAQAARLSGDVIGGTVVNSGSVVLRNAATLDGVTFQGPLNYSTAANTGVTIVDGIILGGGTINMRGTGDVLTLADAETLTGGVLNMTGGLGRVTAQTPTLTIAADFTINTTGFEEISATTVINAGSIGVTGTVATLSLATSTLVNNGAISVAGGDVLKLGYDSTGAATFQTLSVTGANPIALAAGSTLYLGGAETSAQALALLGTAGSVALGLQGILFNTGTSLVVSDTGLLTNLALQADVIGGTIVNSGGSLAVGGGTLDGVTFLGPLTTGSRSATTYIRDGLTLDSLTGTPGGTIDFVGSNQSFVFIDAETLDNATIIVGGTSDALQAQSGALNLGPNVAVTIGTGGTADTELRLVGATIASAATITVASGGTLDLQSATILNSGTINVAAGAALGVAINQFGSLSLANTGAINLASGATLTLAGTVTDAQVFQLLNNQPGVTLDLEGALINTGSTFATGVGPLTNVILGQSGTIVGGTVVTGPDLTVNGGELYGVTLEGPLTLTTGTDLEIAGGLTVLTAAGAAGGTLTLAGTYGTTLSVIDGETLTHATLLTTGVADFITGFPTLNFGPGLTLDANARVTAVSATTLNNSGTIAVSGTSTLGTSTLTTGNQLFLNTTTISNTGVISVGTGALLGIGVSSNGYADSGTLTLTAGSVVHTGGSGSAFALTLATGSTLELGGIATSGQLIGLVGGATLATVVELGTLINTGSVLSSTANGTLGNLILDGDIIGGTVANRGGSLVVAGGTLNGVAFAGALNLGRFAGLDVAGALTLLPATGTTGIGTINASSSFNSITFLNTPTLTNVIVNAATTDLQLTAETPTLVLGSTATLDIGSPGLGGAVLNLYGTTIANAGTITVAGSQTVLGFNSNTIVNSGSIAIAAGDTLALGQSGFSARTALSVVDTGVISIAAGGTLIVGGSETTQQLLALLGTINSPGITVELDGTLINTGATLDVASTGLLSTLILDADVIGGTVIADGGSLVVAGGTFDGVTFEGPLNLGQSNTDLALRDGLTLLTTAGAAGGTINVTGFTELDIQDKLTTLTATTINVLTNATNAFGVLDVLNETGTLVVGAGVTINDVGSQVTLGASGTVVSAANVTLTPGSGYGTLRLDFSADTIINSGTVTIPAGAFLGLDALGPLTTGATLDVVNTGSIALAVGSTLVIGGAETTAQLDSLVGAISKPGVALVLNGSLNNTGTTLALAPGLFGQVTLNDTISHGTVLNAGGTIGFGRVALQTVTFEGPLNVANTGAYIAVTGGLTVLNSLGGAPGTISISGGSDTLHVTAGSTLDNVSVFVSGSAESISHTGTATLGQGVSLTVTGNLTDGQGRYSYVASALVNNGNIAVTGYGAALLLDDLSVTNTGTISVGIGSVLGVSLATTTSASLPFFNTGSVSFAAGSTFLIGGTETDAQLTALLGSLSNPGVVVELDGTLQNTGSVFTTTAGGLLNDVILDATILGGTINTGTGTLAVLGGAFNAVTFQGTLALNSRGGLVTVTNGITLEDATGALPGALTIGGYGAGLSFSDATATLANVAVTVTGSKGEILGETLTIAASAPISVPGYLLLRATSLTNDANITVSGTHGVLSVEGETGTFINNGIITVGSGDVLALNGPFAAGDPIFVGGSGSIVFAAGSTLEIGGEETTAQIEALVGSLVGAQTGVTVELDGEIVNTGAVLDILPTGSLSNVILNADVVGGTIIADGGSLAVIGGEFQTVAFFGPLVIDGTRDGLGVFGGLNLQSQQGGGLGTLVTGGRLNAIYLMSDFSVTNTNIVQTLSNMVIEGTGQNFSIIGPAGGTLVIANSVTSDTSGGVVGFDGDTVQNAGTLLAIAQGATVGIETDVFLNTGSIVVAAGGALGIASQGSLTFSNTGSIEIDSGGSLGLGGFMTTAQFEALVGSLVVNPDVTIGFGVDGELDNTGGTLVVGPSGISNVFGFSQAKVLGGTIVNAGTIGFAGGNQLDAVTFVGPVTLTPNSGVIFYGASTLTSGSAAQDVITVAGTQNSLTFSPGGTMSEGFFGRDEFPIVSAAPAISQELDNALVIIGNPGSAQNSDFLNITGGGTVTLGATTTLDLNGGAEVDVSQGRGGNTTLVNNGTIAAFGSFVELISESSTLSLTTAFGSSFAGAGVIQNNGLIVASANGATIVPGGVVLDISGSFINAGTIAAGGTIGVHVDSTSFSNQGFIALGTGATLDFTVMPAVAGAIIMGDGAETLRFDGTGTFSASVLNFNGADVVDFSGVPFTGVSGTLTNDVYSVFDAAGLVAAINLPGFGGTNADLSVQSDLHGGSEIVTDLPAVIETPPCFAAGTRIRTTDGAVAVEDLVPGMQVVTMTGTRPVMWLGQRRVDCRRHPRPERVQPIRVRAGAFGDGLPVRDLLLSPDHSLFVDGVLIPVQHLLNGATIVRERVASVHYFHMELSAHDVLFAEGLAAESYLDTGNRASFANGGAAAALHPDFFPLGWENACAPLCQSGPIVEAARVMLLKQARAMGYRRSRAAVPALLVDGRIIHASHVAGELYRFLLPANVSQVSIVSETGVPADGDRRQLGVALAGIVAHGSPVALSDAALVSGFYAVEQHGGLARRWTDGQAELDLVPQRHPGVLELRIVETMPGWRTTERVAAAAK